MAVAAGPAVEVEVVLEVEDEDLVGPENRGLRRIPPHSCHCTWLARGLNST